MRKFKDPVIQKFYDKMIVKTRKILGEWNGYDSGFLYHGEINVDDADKPIIIYWMGANTSYSALIERAWLDHNKAELGKIKKLEWTVEWASGNGGVEWIVLNLTDSPTHAIRELYETFGEIWPYSSRDNLEFVYQIAGDTEEYEAMYSKEEREDLVIWWEDTLRKTPFSDLPETYYINLDGHEWLTDDCMIFSKYHRGESAEVQMLPQILEALNAGDLEIDQEDYEEWYNSTVDDRFDTKPSDWPRIAQGTDGKWYLESELTWVNDEWVLPFKTETKRMWDDE